jgi:A/G-specific adenine glycosylase
MQGSLPVRSKKITKKPRWFYYFLVEHQGRLYYRKRSGKDIWENLHEFILFESEKEIKPILAAEKTFGKGKFRMSGVSEPFCQILTHQLINARFARVELLRGGQGPSGYVTASPAALRKKAFPRLIAGYITETGMFKKSPAK